MLVFAAKFIAEGNVAIIGPFDGFPEDYTVVRQPPQKYLMSMLGGDNTLLCGMKAAKESKSQSECSVTWRNTDVEQSCTHHT
jgi:hypothetical protein